MTKVVVLTLLKKNNCFKDTGLGFQHNKSPLNLFSFPLVYLAQKACYLSHYKLYEPVLLELKALDSKKEFSHILSQNILGLLKIEFSFIKILIPFLCCVV